jgi:D-threo-aldose 1-dehydrogenase
VRNVRSLPSARVGQTDLQVSIIGLGTASIGTLYSDVSEAQAVETVHFALENGVRFLDTAPYYSQLLVEKRLGVALAGVPRDSYVLSTKVGRPLGTDDMDYSAESIKRGIAGSLERLRLDHVDILHLHDPDSGSYHQALDQAYPVLVDMRRQGLIKAIGVGVNYWEILTQFASDAEFDCFILAGRYTLLEQGALNALNRFHSERISVFGAGIYNSGILARGADSGAWYQYREAPAAIRDKVRKIEAVCAQYSVPLHAAAVQFAKTHPAMTSLIIGAESPAQLAMSLDGLFTPIPAEFWAALRDVGLVDPAAPFPRSS